jgi:hypothetical protein
LLVQVTQNRAVGSHAMAPPSHDVVALPRRYGHRVTTIPCRLRGEGWQPRSVRYEHAGQEAHCQATQEGITMTTELRWCPEREGRRDDSTSTEWKSVATESPPYYPPGSICAGLWLRTDHGGNRYGMVGRRNYGRRPVIGSVKFCDFRRVRIELGCAGFSSLRNLYSAHVWRIEKACVGYL